MASAGERTITTIAVRLGEFRAMTRAREQLPEDLSPVDTEQIAKEAFILKEWGRLKKDLKGDLKWLHGYLRQNSPFDSEGLQAVYLFDQILEAI